MIDLSRYGNSTARSKFSQKMEIFKKLIRKNTSFYGEGLLVGEVSGLTM